jgi:hypothetical protein
MDGNWHMKIDTIRRLTLFAVCWNKLPQEPYMHKSRRVPKNSIIQYEELKAAAGGSGSGGGGHGSGSGRVIKFFRLSVPPPVADCAGAKPPKFQLPKANGSQIYPFGRIVAIGLCMFLLNFLYYIPHPLNRLIILPLMLYFMWTIWKREGGTWFRDREESEALPP